MSEIKNPDAKKRTDIVREIRDYKNMYIIYTAICERDGVKAIKYSAFHAQVKGWRTMKSRVKEAMDIFDKYADMLRYKHTAGEPFPKEITEKAVELNRMLDEFKSKKQTI